MALPKSKNLTPVRKIRRVAEPVVKKLRDSDILVELCGGLRRGEVMAKNAVLVVSSINWTWFVVDENFDAQQVTRFGSESGGVELSFRIDGVTFNCRSATNDYWGTAVLFLTGSVGFIKTMVAHARCLGYALRYSGLFLGEERIAGKTEKQVFEVLGFPFIEPDRRFPQKPYSKMFKGAPVKIC